MESNRHNKVVVNNRDDKYNRALIVFATGDYNQYLDTLILSAQKHFPCHIYIFTDLPEACEEYKNVTAIHVEHIGWPATPLLRWEMMNRHMDLFEETYLFLIDAEAKFVHRVNQSIQGYRVATLHRNIMRFKDEFNYETRKESTAFVGKKEGEKYYACGFIGAQKKEFARMTEVIADNIKTDIRNGIRAIWGDESHLNRYLIDNRPTLVLPPNYMCPETNPFFKPFIVHRNKSFKKINKEDTENYLHINPEQYEKMWKN